MITSFELGDVVLMKKSHACGENEWTIIRVGADVKIKCNRCGRIVMLDRADFVRMGKKILIHQQQANDAAEGCAQPMSKNEQTGTTE
ncbi:MAG TPA: DUF951 domain-containing protein [Clostridiales bacterium]|jgi:hypothetical protein|nr:DUF951 domain-containing protein [Clostridiales bacterium]